MMKRGAGGSVVKSNDWWCALIASTLIVNLFWFRDFKLGYIKVCVFFFSTPLELILWDATFGQKPF